MAWGEVSVASVDTGDVHLELSPAPLAVPRSAGRRVIAAEFLRRSLHDGRLRALAIFVASAGVTSVYQSTFGGILIAAAVFTISWTLAAHATERSLRTVRIVAGQWGVPVFSALGGLAVASGFAFWSDLAGANRSEVLLMTLLAFAILLAAELTKARLTGMRTRILLVGGGPSAGDVIGALAQDPWKPFTVVGVVDAQTGLPAIGGVEVLGPVSDLHRIVGDVAPDLVVVTVDRGRPEVFKGLARVAGLGFRAVDLPEFYEHVFGRVPVRSMTDAWFMSVLHLYQRSYTRVSKRAFDLAVASLGLFLTAPLFPLIALMIRRSGPVFYRQTRVGEQGMHFTMLKFRTMRPDSELSGAVWAQAFDPRTTRIGSVLRKTRLDELPQLINVLRGEMSIVGPRPERPEFLELLEETVPFWTRRQLLRPGITGWAQLCSGYAADSQATEEKLAYDFWYLRHQSLIVDLLICVRTLPVMLFAAGR